MNLLPSVTTILSTLAKPALEQWKLKQVALAAHAIPPMPNETQEYFIQRVIAGGLSAAQDAAHLGSRIHRALEAEATGQPFDPVLRPYIGPVIDWTRSHQIQLTATERIVVNPHHGFAGCIDALFTWADGAGMGILDYKTTKTRPGVKVSIYDSHPLQLAAYAATAYGEEALDGVLAVNIFISTSEPGRIEVFKYEDLRRHWVAFQHLAALWRYTHTYDPRQLGPDAEGIANGIGGGR